MLQHLLGTVLLPYSFQKCYLTGRCSLKFILFINIWSNTLLSPKPWEISQSGRNNASCRCSFILKCVRRHDGKGRANVLWAFVISTVKAYALLLKFQEGKRSLEVEHHDGNLLVSSLPLWVHLSLKIWCSAAFKILTTNTVIIIQIYTSWMPISGYWECDFFTN